MVLRNESGQGSIGATALVALLGDWRGADPGGLARSLAERIRLLALDGRIPAGTRLPSERELCDRLDLSRTTVAAAYARLRDLGFARSLRGSGTQVRLPVPRLPESAPSGHEIDLSRATLPALPWLAEAAREAAEDLPSWLHTDGYDPIGLPEVRAALAQRYEERGLPTEPEQILVTLGAQHAIALLARTLLGRGDRAVIESPSYPHAFEALRLAGARLVPVPVSETAGATAGAAAEIAEVEAFEQAFRRASPAAAFLMPDFQNPTGRSLSPEARDRILAAARREGTVVVADETTAELDIDRGFAAPPLAAQGDAVLIGSAGKTLWGGLRIGWIRADRELIARLAQARVVGDLGTPILEQLLLARLLPRTADALELRREQLRAGRELLTGLLAERLPGWRVPPTPGGIATWVDLGAPLSSRLALAARSRGLVVPAGPRFGIDGAYEGRLRLPLCGDPDELRAAVGILADSWGDLPGAESLGSPGARGGII
ncbi:PLP-dependent aminotransferase family protein [Leucobacter iarius]|uniref:PLP-dependent aminotransferase family protein n=1 Tax=Leucobacter iarius TaxID=333963 RepID=A0ABP4XIG6_9MICO